MLFYIGEVPVVFPHGYVYPEQLEYMKALKEGLDKKGHLLLEMPSGTGKTITLLSFVIAYINHHYHDPDHGGTGLDATSNALEVNESVLQHLDRPTHSSNRIHVFRNRIEKMVYCTRTVVEMTKTLDELKKLIALWQSPEYSHLPQKRDMIAVSLSARKNLCVDPYVSSLKYGQLVDAACNSRISKFASSSGHVDSARSGSTELNPRRSRRRQREENKDQNDNDEGGNDKEEDEEADDVDEITRASNHKGGCPFFKPFAQHYQITEAERQKKEAEKSSAAAAGNRYSKQHAPPASQQTDEGFLYDIEDMISAGEDKQVKLRNNRHHASSSDNTASSIELPPGVYTVSDLRRVGLQRGLCPYFAARHALAQATVIVESYMYLIDSKVSPLVKKHLPSNTVIVMDEGHNVDDNCIESMSMVIAKGDAFHARDVGMPYLQMKLDRMQQVNKNRLQEEYSRLVEGLRRTTSTTASTASSSDGSTAIATTHSSSTRAVLPSQIPEDVARAALPGNLRHATHFIVVLGKLVQYFCRFLTKMGHTASNQYLLSSSAGGGGLQQMHASTADPLTFLTKVKEFCAVDVHHMRWVYDRLTELMKTLEIGGGERTYKLRHVINISDFVSTLGKYYQVQENLPIALGALPSSFQDQQPQHVVSGNGAAGVVSRHNYNQNHNSYNTHTHITTVTAAPNGTGKMLPSFVVIAEPFDIENPGVPDPVLKLACVNAALAIEDVFAKYQSVVLTSGTLSPLSMYPRMLGFTPCVARSFPMTLPRKCLCPVIVTRTADQSAIVVHNHVPDGTHHNNTATAGGYISSSYSTRTDTAAQAHVSHTYATFLIQLARTVPDGIVCFFTGYRYMGEVLADWHKNGVLEKLLSLKLVFIETQSVEETSEALHNYRKACDVGRGAIFLSIARGKVSEGIDFDRHYGRVVCMFGVPFLPPTDRMLTERIAWMEHCLGITDSEYRNFDAMRQASQCIGRVIRNKTDYGMMILIDKRFTHHDKRRKLPMWIQEQLRDRINVSTEAALSIANDFFMEMAQPWEGLQKGADLGSTLYDIHTLTAMGHGPPLPSSANV